MDKRLSEKILQNFTFATMEVLNDYITDRIQDVYSRMETEKDMSNINKYQGMIAELRNLSKMRDYAAAVVKLKE